jgi:DNA-binding transcriptional MerR regulator
VALLSFIEASKTFNIPESTLRYWVSTHKIEPVIEIRNGKEVTVIDEEALHLYISSRDGSRLEEQSTPESEGQASNLQIAKYYQEYYQPIIAQHEATIAELHKQIEELQYERGELNGTVQQLQERLQEAKAEIQEWRREVAVTQERRPWWKFWD